MKELALILAGVFVSVFAAVFVSVLREGKK